ncbi:MAG: AMP-binding protein [Acidobacteria bacterium]|nr:AMP-binding protein [Acidobacteriota bacterium]
MIEFNLIKPIDVHLRERSQQQGNQTAYYDANTSVTYQELEQRSARLASALLEMGIHPGESVAIYLPNSVLWVESCLAVVRRGAIVVPISYEASEDEVLYRLQDVACVAVISSAEREPRLAGLRSLVPSLRAIVLTGIEATATADDVRSYESLMRGAVRPDAARGIDIDAPSFILYTSGTTGKAKGVVLTQRSNLWVIASCWQPIAGLGPADHMLCPLPLFHGYALDLVVLGTVVTGATTRVMERFSTDGALSLLRSGQFTIFPAVPTMFHYLLERAGDLPLDFGKLRVCISAGAIMSATLNAEFERRTGVPLIDGLGTTETSSMITLNWPNQPRILGSCGLPLPGLAVRIVNPKTRQDVAFGEEGELIVRGPNVMQSYHNKPEETAKTLVDGWFLTGDLARSDLNGFITITGRLKEIIIRGGQNIAPAEIEEVVQQFPGVLDCAVVAGKHQFLGEVPVLFVACKPGARIGEGDLKDYCSAHLSSYKVPDSIRYVDQIPRTGSGKILRFQLQQLLG